MVEILNPTEEVSEVDRYKDINVSDVIPWYGRQDEPSNLSFLNSTISLASTGSGRDRTYFARFNHPVFQSELYDILESIAPIKKQDVGGVYDDWVKFQSLNPDDVARMRRHATSEKIGESWAKFAKNYEGLFKALTTQSPQFLEKELQYIGGEPYEFARDEYIKGADLRSSFDELDLGGEQGDRNFYSDTLRELEAIASSVGIEKNGLNFANIRTDYWRTEEHEKLLRIFFQNHPEYINPQSMGDRYACSLTFTANMLDERYVFYVPRGSQVNQIYKSEDGYTIGYKSKGIPGSTKYSADVVENGSGFSMLFEDDTENTVYPVLAWNKRKFNGLRSRRTIISDPDELHDFGIKPEDNPLLGMMALEYLDIKATKNWPERQSYGNKGNGQMMRAAQVPVLSLQFQEDLERSDILANIEKKAQLTS